jgi:gamma-glutamyltranspeptidase / glutathione hydrolase
MDTNFYQNWDVRKPVASGANGVVASHHKAAAEVGAAVLRDGGNAIDAAIATSFAVSVVEPWMSGIGGLGYMMVYLAKEKRVLCINGGAISPSGLDVANYPMTNGESGDLFTWPAVKDDRNVQGYHSIATPGYVATVGLAHDKYATKSWAELLAPATVMAERGLPANWATTLYIAGAARDIVNYPETKSIYMPDGFPPVAIGGKPIPHLPMGNLARTLKRLAAAGHRDFYEGEIAAQITADMQAGGGSLSATDLAEYRALELASLAIPHGDAVVHAAPGLTAGPTMADAMSKFAGKITGDKEPNANDYMLWATAMRDAFETRFDTMGDIDDSRDPASTTHLTVIDGEGNIVSFTQTLLSAFGSKVVLPETGILMNNGIMWFDPRPGLPNSIGPTKRPLSNMCPVIVTADDEPWFGAGGSGGRKIMSAVMQLTSMVVDCGMDLESAFHQPRIDYSGDGATAIDTRLDDDVETAIAAHMPTRREEQTILPNNFAKPNGVMKDPDTGEFQGAADVSNPVSGAIAG